MYMETLLREDIQVIRLIIKDCGKKKNCLQIKDNDSIKNIFIKKYLKKLKFRKFYLYKRNKVLYRNTLKEVYTLLKISPEHNGIKRYYVERKLRLKYEETRRILKREWLHTYIPVLALIVTAGAFIFEIARNNDYDNQINVQIVCEESNEGD